MTPEARYTPRRWQLSTMRSAADSRAVSGFSQKMALTPAWAAATTAPALAPTGSTGMAILIDSRANISS